MIRVVILGQPYWSLRLLGVLQGLHPEVTAVFLSPKTLFTPAGLRSVARADYFLRMGYRPGATTWRGRLFDALWSLLRTLNPRARGIHYWIGTDVFHTLKDAQAGRLRPGPLATARDDLHWADAPWLVAELAQVGLTASSVPLPVPLGDVRPPERLPAPFTVLTYIPDGRWAFYDGPSIYTAAQALPAIRFEVIGGGGAQAPGSLPNLTFFGWQQDIRPFLARATVLVRLVRHDGTGGTVREALEAGRHVIYSQPMPCVHQVPYGHPEALETALRSLLGRFEAGDLPPNLEGHAYVAATFDLKACLATYLADLQNHLPPKRN